MATLVVPRWDPDEPWPTLGPQVCDLIEERMIFGPGSLKGEPAVLDDDKRAFIYSAYEVYPKGHQWAGRRRYKRCGYSIRKGVAKCLAPDVLVTMADGTLRQAQHLTPGDLVLGYANGRLVESPVAAVEWQPRAPMYRLVTERGRELIVTDEHPVRTRGTRWRVGMPKRRRYASCDPDVNVEEWVPARELAVGDRVVIGLGWTGDGDLSAEDAWLLGAFTGDGSPDGRFTSEDAAIVARISERFPMTHCGRYDYYARGSRPFLREHGLYGCNSRTKRVPAAVMRATPKAVAAFLAGYLDTDGWVTCRALADGKHRLGIEWGSVSRELLADCQHLLAGLGINAQLHAARSTYKGERHESWKLAVRDAEQARALADLLIEHVAHSRKGANLQALGMHGGRCTFAQRDTDRLVTVERLPDAPSVAVEVADTHSHVTAGVVTHNTELLAWISLAELHPDGPVRCDGFDANGDPVGRPVRDPYIPLLAVTVEQVEELGYGALYVMVTEGPDADMFDATLERIIRLSPTGRADGKAVPLSNSPGSRDGARTTFQGFDEPHRLILPRQKQAHETMVANLEKRSMEDPWGLYVGTAGEPGEGSIAEGLHKEAEKIDRGEIDDPQLFYVHRWAKGTYDLTDLDQRIEAVREASGPIPEFSPGQFHSIAKQWDREDADKKYLERVWLNRWTRSDEQAFDPKLREALTCDRIIEPGSFVTAGFDGARFRDSTGIVITDILTGMQQVHAVWEKPLDVPEGETWEIPEREVDAAFHDLVSTYDVWRFNADPPHWTSTVGGWAGEHDFVEEWWTNRIKPMAYAVRNYREAMATGEVSYAGQHPHDKRFADHLAAAGRSDVNLWDDEGKRLFILRKLHPDRKFDLQMAAILSWEARLAALAAGAKPTPRRRSTRVRRLR